jgi:ABC-type transport system substrate-binding protein
MGQAFYLSETVLYCPTKQNVSLYAMKHLVSENETVRRECLNPIGAVRHERPLPKKGSHTVKKRILLAPVVAGIVAVALAACSSPTPANDEPRDVAVQLYNAPATFSPLIAGVGGNALIQELHWDALVGIDDQGQYDPRLAESWTVNDDGTVYTFTLRDGVKWSDGEPLTAEDVVFSYNLYANPASGSAQSGRFADVVGQADVKAGTAATVSGFAAVDDATFTMTLTAPNSAKLIDLAEPQLPIVPEHVYASEPVAGLAESAVWREPAVGIGPYVFSSWVSDDEVEFVPNPQYRSQLGLDHVYARFLATDAAQAQLQTGEIDFSQIAAAEYDTISGLPGVNAMSVGGAGIMALHSAMDTGKLADPLVRQAILYAIDRQAIVDQVLGGHGQVVSTLIHDVDWLSTDGLNDYPYDPEKAKSLLAEAGWDPATPVRLEIVLGPKDREQVLTIIAGQLQAVGMNAAVTPYDNSALSTAIKNRDFDLLLSGYGLFNNDPAAMNARLLCNNGALSGYCDPELDALLKAGIATTDQDERAKIYDEAQLLFNETLPILPLYVADTLAGTSDRLQGFKLNPLPTSAFWNAAEWTVG